MEQFAGLIHGLGRDSLQKVDIVIRVELHHVLGRRPRWPLSNNNNN